MTTVMLVGAWSGSALLLLVLQFDTGRASGASELARLDAARARTRRTATLHDDEREERESLRVRKLGAQVRAPVRGPRLEPPGRAPGRPRGHRAAPSRATSG